MSRRIKLLSCEQKNEEHWIDLARDDLRSCRFLCVRSIEVIGGIRLSEGSATPIRFLPCHRHLNALPSNISASGGAAGGGGTGFGMYQPEVAGSSSSPPPPRVDHRHHHESLLVRPVVALLGYCMLPRAARAGAGSTGSLQTRTSDSEAASECPLAGGHYLELDVT